MGPSTVAPFDRSFLRRIEEGGSRAEGLWKRVPFLGWIVASHLWAKRAGPFRRLLFEQIEARPRTSGAAWGGASRIAQVVCEVAQTQMGWPSASFVPNDPFAVVFWSYDDGLDARAAMRELEERFECGLPDEVVGPFVDGTLGEFVAFLAERCPDALTRS